MKDHLKNGCLVWIIPFGISLFILFSFNAKPLQRPNILLIMSDNQSWNHAGVYGDKIVKTPNIDKMAAQGIRFTHAFGASPSCSPSRAGLLTGQDIWRLKEGANLWGTLSQEFEVYPDILEKNGYQIGYQGKGWGPGNYQVSGRKRNPAGDLYQDFGTFLASNNGSDKPWTFWFSSKHPHRPYDVGSGKLAGIDIEKIEVPRYLPDTPEVRQDIADYYASIQQFDQQIGAIIEKLKTSDLQDQHLSQVCTLLRWEQNICEVPIPFLIM